MGFRRGPWLIRLALVLAVLGATLLAGPASRAAMRSEFFGIVQGGGLGTRDLKGLERARIHSDRFMLNWGWVQRRGARVSSTGREPTG